MKIMHTQSNFWFLKAHSKNIYIRIIKIYGRPIFLIPWIPFAEEFKYTLNNIENSFYSLFIKYIPKITI